MVDGAASKGRPTKKSNKSEKKRKEQNKCTKKKDRTNNSNNNNVHVSQDDGRAITIVSCSGGIFGPAEKYYDRLTRARRARVPRVYACAFGLPHRRRNTRPLCLLRRQDDDRFIFILILLLYLYFFFAPLPVLRVSATTLGNTIIPIYLRTYMYKYIHTTFKDYNDDNNDNNNNNSFL